MADRMQRIAKGNLKMAKLDPSKRTFNKEFAEKLAESIKSDGLLHPPIVANNGDGNYTILSGRHRIYACCKVLGWADVECCVLESGEEGLVESIEIAANLWVNPLNDQQMNKAVTRWREIYLARNPRKKSVKSGGTVDVKGDGFTKEVAAVLQVSPATADRIVTTAQMISDEDATLLTAAGVPKSSVDKIAALKDADAVKAAVNLAAAGKDVNEAIRVGKEVKAKKKAEKPAKPKKTRKPKDGEAPNEEAPKAEAPKKAADMTDDVWLETYCKKLLDALPFKAAFRRDAILYRRVAEKTVAYRTATKKAIAEAKKVAENGIFFANLWRVVRTSHPMNWLICDGCNGTGHVADDKTKQCNKCLGGGYKVKYEET